MRQDAVSCSAVLDATATSTLLVQRYSLSGRALPSDLKGSCLSARPIHIAGAEMPTSVHPSIHSCFQFFPLLESWSVPLFLRFWELSGLISRFEGPSCHLNYRMPRAFSPPTLLVICARPTRRGSAEKISFLGLAKGVHRSRVIPYGHKVS